MSVEVGFEYATATGQKIRCKVCGIVGYPTAPDFVRGWQTKCRAGHPYRCSCGRVFVNKAAIATHRRSHRDH